MVRVFLAIVAANLVLVGLFVAVGQRWPSFFEDEEGSAYTCKTLDNELDPAVKVCISKTDITDGRFDACRRPVGVGIVGRIGLVYDPDQDTYCAVELPDDKEATR